MTPMTISAQVVNGQILPEQSVAALEGQRVFVTLTVVPKDSANGKTAELPPDGNSKKSSIRSRRRGSKLKRIFTFR